MSADPQKVHVRLDIVGAEKGAVGHIETIVPAEFSMAFEPIYSEGDEGLYPVNGYYRQPEMIGADLTLRLRMMRDEGAGPDGVLYRIITDEAAMAPLRIPAADLKMLRETLCRAQNDANDSDMRRLSALIAEIDRHRPLGPDGKHGDLHTPTCGCEDRS